MTAQNTLRAQRSGSISHQVRLDGPSLKKSSQDLGCVSEHLQATVGHIVPLSKLLRTNVPSEVMRTLVTATWSYGSSMLTAVPEMLSDRPGSPNAEDPPRVWLLD